MTSIVYLKDYYSNKKPEYKEEHIEHKCGIFSIRYISTDKMPPDNSFGLYSWKLSHVPVHALFYENDELLFSKEFTGSPSIVIHGDGKTKTKTFFTFNIHGGLQIYDMDNKLIKSPTIGFDIFVEFKRVNDSYAIGMTSEMCTHDPSTSLINLDMFFGIVECTENRPYDNSRVHVPLTSDVQNEPTLIPIIATEKGFIVENIHDREISYKFTEPNLVLYDDAFDDNIYENNNDGIYVDFYENSERVDIFDILNMSANTQNEITKNILEHGGVAVNIGDETKTKNALDKISQAYDNIHEQNKKPIQQTFAMIKPDAVANGNVDDIKYAIGYKFKIVNSKEYTFNETDIDILYAEHIGKDFFPRLKEFMMSGPSLLLILEAEDAIKKWRKLIGPTNVQYAKQSAPHAMRALYGNETNSSKNACHGSDSVDSAQREINFFNLCNANLLDANL
jgi:nucleoside diphosphate kinase